MEQEGKMRNVILAGVVPFVYVLIVGKGATLAIVYVLYFLSGILFELQDIRQVLEDRRTP
jgi:hypothetical protein